MTHDPFARTRDLGLLVARVGFGLSHLYFHGWSKITGGPEVWHGVGSAMQYLGIGFGHTAFGFIAALAESVGALCFAAGFLFRPASALLAATMAVASVMHISTGNGTPAHTLKNLFFYAGLFLVGPGRYSVDAALRARRAGAAQ